MPGWKKSSSIPRFERSIDDDEVMNEANEEHHLVHVLIAELKELEPSDDTFKAKFTVLGELVKHHVKEEEGEMFPRLRRPRSIGRSSRRRCWSVRSNSWHKPKMVRSR